MDNNLTFKPIRVRRQTRETTLSFVFSPRSAASDMVELPNRLLGHFLDHLLKACGVSLETSEVDWPGSWRFDHVLCEDVGQIVGRGFAAIHDQRAATCGVAGRGSAKVCMDESLVECVVSFEGRPRCEWISASGESIDGFVDAWYDDSGVMSGWSAGTNLRQFFDGFAIGARCTLSVDLRTIDARGAGNPHHVFEAVFRALGDAVAAALGIGAGESRLPNDTSGFAGAAKYTVETLEASSLG